MWQLLHKSSMGLIFNDENAKKRATSKHKFEEKKVASISSTLFCILTTTAVSGWSGSCCLNSRMSLDLLFSSTLKNVSPWDFKSILSPGVPVQAPASGYPSVQPGPAHISSVLWTFSKGILALPASCTIDPPGAGARDPI